MKYKIVGIVNILIGTFYIVVGGSLNFIVYPQLAEIYTQLEVNPKTFYISRLSSFTNLIIFLILGLLNAYFGSRLLRNKSNKQRNNQSICIEKCS